MKVILKHQPFNGMGEYKIDRIEVREFDESLWPRAEAMEGRIISVHHLDPERLYQGSSCLRTVDELREQYEVVHEVYVSPNMSRDA